MGPKVIKCYLWWDTPHLHIKPNLDMCRKGQRSQIFKQNWIILICSKFYCIFSDLSPPWLLWMCVGVGVWVVGVGVPSICVHMHTHACTCIMLKYTGIEIANGHPWRHPCLSCLTCMCMWLCMCMCVCMCMYMYAWDTTPHTHTPIHPPHLPPRGWPRNQLKCNKTWTKIRYFNSVWRFKIREDSSTYGWMYILMGGWVDGWIYEWVHVKSVKI